MSGMDEKEGELKPTLGAAPMSNTDRLRVHLTNRGLAAALLSAWERSEPDERQARMLATVHDFYDPNPPDDDAATTP
jgi:hypothetical protein